MRSTSTRKLTAIGVASALALAACSAGDDAPSSDAPSSDAPTTPATTEGAAAVRPDHCPEAALPPGTELGAAELRWTPGCIPFVRTPDERFADLVDFPYEPKYVEVDGLRMAYVDEGPADGEVVLMLHGQPTWSYLYRKMIPVLVDAGYRAIALDLMGMGRSDKPVQLADYTYLRHVGWVHEFLDALDLRDVTVFVQDWGSLIGLRVVGDDPDRFARVVVANGRLPVVPEGFEPISFPDPPLPNDDLVAPFELPESEIPEVEAHPAIDRRFAAWAVFALTGTRFRPSEILDALTVVDLSPDELAAYDAPFPDRIYMSGVRVFPSLINTLGEAPTNAAAREVFDRWTKPLLTVFGRRDFLLGRDAVQAEMRDQVPGAAGQPHHAYDDAGHFVQEDEGADLARRVVEFMRANPL